MTEETKSRFDGKAVDLDAASKTALMFVRNVVAMAQREKPMLVRMMYDGQPVVLDIREMSRIFVQALNVCNVANRIDPTIQNMQIPAHFLLDGIMQSYLYACDTETIALMDRVEPEMIDLANVVAASDAEH